MLHIVHQAIERGDESLPAIRLRVERLTLAKRRWRGTAEDGTDFGFELSAPLRHGQTIFQSAIARYVVHQETEPLLEVSLEIAPSAAAGIGWAIGNLHLELSAEASRLLAPDQPAVRQLLGRLSVPYRPTTGLFRPGHFIRGAQPSHELGPSHKH